MINTYIYNISSNTQNQEICEAFSDAWAFNASSSSSGGSNADVLQAASQYWIVLSSLHNFSLNADSFVLIVISKLDKRDVMDNIFN